MTFNEAKEHLADQELPNEPALSLVRQVLLALVFFLIALISIIAPVALPNSYAFTVAAGVGLSLCAIALLLKPREFGLGKQGNQHEASGESAKVGRLFLARLRNLRLSYLIPIEIIGLSFVINGIAFGVLAYLVIGFTFCIVLPLLYLVVGSSGHTDFFTAISRGLSAAFWVLALVSIISGPGYDGRQYSSFLGNPNQLGIILSSVIACMLFLSWKAYRNGKKPLMIFHFTSCMVAFAFCYLTASRGAILAVSVQFVVYAVLFALSTRKAGADFWKRLAKACLVAAIAVYLSFSAIFAGLTTVKEDIAEALPQLQLNIDYESLGGFSLLDGLHFTQDRFGKGLDGNEDDALTSGRIGIWKDFLANLSLAGHESESRALESGSREYEHVNAHNVYIQVAYSAGIVAGVAMLALAVVVFRDLLRSLFTLIRNKRLAVPIVFFCLAASNFLMQSLVHDGYMLFRYLTATLFWMSLLAYKTPGLEHVSKPGTSASE